LSFETAQDIFSDEVWRLIHEQIGRKKLKIFKHSRCADIDLRIRKPMQGHRLKEYNRCKQKPNGAVIELRGETLLKVLLSGIIW
jgi:hypothetical protein